MPRYNIFLEFLIFKNYNIKKKGGRMGQEDTTTKKEIQLPIPPPPKEEPAEQYSFT